MQRFCQIPRHELHAIVKIDGKKTPNDLAHIFSLTQARRFVDRSQYIERIGENRIFAMLYVLGRSMKCWVETEYAAPSQQQGTVKGRWRVAHS